MRTVVGHCQIHIAVSIPRQDVIGKDRVENSTQGCSGSGESTEDTPTLGVGACPNPLPTHPLRVNSTRRPSRSEFCSTQGQMCDYQLRSGANPVARPCLESTKLHPTHHRRSFWEVTNRILAAQGQWGPGHQNQHPSRWTHERGLFKSKCV